MLHIRFIGEEIIFSMILSLLFLFHAEKERIQSTCEKRTGIQPVSGVYVHFYILEQFKILQSNGYSACEWFVVTIVSAKYSVF